MYGNQPVEPGERFTFFPYGIELYANMSVLIWIN